MSLKAGYSGIKKSMIGLINSLSSTKLIKSFGDGLNLTNAGKLNLTAATASKLGGIKVGEGLEINSSGLLSVNISGGIDYSLDEVDTGLTWIDDKPIYQKTFQAESPSSGSVQLLTGVDTLVDAYGSAVIGSASYAIPAYEAASYRAQIINTNHVVTLENTGVGAYQVTVLYTKYEEE